MFLIAEKQAKWANLPFIRPAIRPAGRTASRTEFCCRRTFVFWPYLGHTNSDLGESKLDGKRTTRSTTLQSYTASHTATRPCSWPCKMWQAYRILLQTHFRILAISWSYELRFGWIKACWKEDNKIYNSTILYGQQAGYLAVTNFQKKNAARHTASRPYT